MKNGNQVTWIEMFIFNKKIVQKRLQTTGTSINNNADNFEEKSYENIEGIKITSNISI